MINSLIKYFTIDGRPTNEGLKYFNDLERRLSPQFASYEAADLALTTAWQSMPATTGAGTVLLPGTYVVQVTALADGTNNNAEAQFRVGSAGAYDTGDIIDVGNNTISITGNLVRPEAYPITLEARGLNCTLSNIRYFAYRIGIANG